MPPAPQQLDSVSVPAASSAPSLSNLTAADYGRPAPAANPALSSLGAPHVNSFNFMLDEGLRIACEDLKPVEFAIPGSEEAETRVEIRVTECEIQRPEVPSASVGTREPRVFPTEARQRGTNYKAPCIIT